MEELRITFPKPGESRSAEDGKPPIRPKLWWFPTVTEVHGDDRRTGWSSCGWLELRTHVMEKCTSWEDLVNLVLHCMSAPLTRDGTIADRLLSSSSSFFFGAIVPGTGPKCPRTSKFVPAVFTKLEGSMTFINLESGDIAFKTGTGMILHRTDIHFVCVCEERSQFYARLERREREEQERRTQYKVVCRRLVITSAVAGAIAALVLFCLR
jgi:hypothetical protein